MEIKHLRRLWVSAFALLFIHVSQESPKDADECKHFILHEADETEEKVSPEIQFGLLLPMMHCQ